LGCINRDKNAVKNFKKLVDHWLKTGERLEKYRRQKLLTPLGSKSKASNNSKPLAGTFMISQKETKVRNQKEKSKDNRKCNNKSSQQHKVHSGI
jgi:hypothetical protein